MTACISRFSTRSSGSIPKGVIQPNLAAEVPTQKNGGISEDGLKWRIRLRDDVRWHDGKPFTAEDVKFTLELIIEPELPQLAHDGALVGARHHGGLARRDYLADGAGFRTVPVVPDRNLHRAETHPGEGG